MRTCAINETLAGALGRLVATNRRPSSARVRIQDIERVEREFGVQLPDQAIAYMAAGVSVWGDGPLGVAMIRERTLTVREFRHEDFTGDVGDEAEAQPFVVIDDDSNGNYIAVLASDGADSPVVWFLDHEESYSPGGPSIDLVEAIERRLEAVDVQPPFVPFTVELVDEPDPEPAVRRVRHAKFGAGTVIAESDDVVTVQFETAGQKKLKRSFLTFEA